MKMNTNHPPSTSIDEMDTPYLPNPNALVRQRKQWQGKLLTPLINSPKSHQKNNNENNNNKNKMGSDPRLEFNSDESEEEDDERLAQLLKSIDDADDRSEAPQTHGYQCSSRNNNSSSSSGGEGFLDKLESENAQLKGKLQAERDEWEEKNDQWTQQMSELESEIARLHESGKTERELWKREKQLFEQRLQQQSSSPQQTNNNSPLHNRKEEELLTDLRQISEEAVRLEAELQAVTEDRDELLRKQNSGDYKNFHMQQIKQQFLQNACAAQPNNESNEDDKPPVERIKKSLEMTELMQQRDAQIREFEQKLQTKESQLQQLKRQIQQLEQTNSSIISNQTSTIQKHLKEQSQNYDIQIQQMHHRHQMQHQQMMEQANQVRIKEKNDMNNTLKQHEQIIHEKDFTLQQYQQGHSAIVQKQLNAQSKAHEIQIQQLKEQHCKDTETLKATIQTQQNRIQQYQNQFTLYENRNLTQQQQIQTLEKDIHQHIQTKNKHIQQVDGLLQQKASQEKSIKKLQRKIREQEQFLQQEPQQKISAQSHCDGHSGNTTQSYNIRSPKSPKKQKNLENTNNPVNWTPVTTNKPSSTNQSQSSKDRRRKLYEAKKLLSSKYVHAAKAAQAKAGDSPRQIHIISPLSPTPSQTENRNLGDAPSPKADPPEDFVYNNTNFISPTSTPNTSRTIQSHSDDDSSFESRRTPDYFDDQLSCSITESTLESTPTSTIRQKDSFARSFNQFVDGGNNNFQPVIWEETSNGSSLKEQLGCLVRVLESHTSRSPHDLQESLSDVSEDVATLDSTGQNSVVKVMYNHFRALYKKLSAMELELEKTKLQNRKTVGRLQKAMHSPNSVASPPQISRQHVKSEASNLPTRENLDINESDETVLKLKRKLKSKEEENNGLKRSLKDAVRLMKPLKEHIATTEDEKRQLRDKLFSLQKQMEKLEKEMNHKEMKIQNMLHHISDDSHISITQDIIQQGELQAKDDEIINLHESVHNITSALEQKEKELAAVKMQLANSVTRAMAAVEFDETDIKSLRHQLESVQAELEISKSHEEAFRDALQNVSRQKAEILIHERGHEHELDELREELKDKLEVIVETRGKVSELKEELSEQVNALRRSEDEREELRESLDSANAKLIELATKLPVVKSSLKETKENEQLLNSKLREATNLLKPLKLHLETAEREKQVIADKLAQAQVKIATLEAKSSEVETISKVANISMEKYKKQSKYYEAALKRLIDEKADLEEEMLKSEEERNTSRANTETIITLREQLSSVLELNKTTKAMLDEVSETNQALLADLKRSELDKIEATEELEILRRKLVESKKEMENAKFIAASCLIRIDEMVGGGDNCSWISGEEGSVGSNNSAKLSIISEESAASESGNSTKLRSLVECVKRLEQQVGELMLKNNDLEDTISDKNKVLLSFMSKFNNPLDTII